MCALLKGVNPLDEECLTTLLCEAACIINSRPLSADNLSDPCNFLPISPNNFLTMKPSIVLAPPGEFKQDDLYSKKRWRHVQYLANQFWLKWRREYLQNIQLRRKWSKSCANLRIGDLVLLKDEQLPRCEWHMCKVKEVFTSNDGRVRSAKLLLGVRDNSKGTILCRPIQRMVFLMSSE